VPGCLAEIVCILAPGNRLGVWWGIAGETGYRKLMETRMQIAILIVAALLGVLVLFRLLPARVGSNNGPTRDRRTSFGTSNAFHAVSIQPAENACPAVESIKVQRFLSEEAPGLPLPDCNAVDCSCKYVHYADRRSGTRNRRLGLTEEPGESEFWSLRDRRGAAGSDAVGRRQDDVMVA